MGNSSDGKQYPRTDKRECGFPGCGWSIEREVREPVDETVLDNKSLMHYEREHAGKVRVSVTLEMEQLHAGRDMEAVRGRILDNPPEVAPYEVSHVRTEVLEEPSDHSDVDIVVPE